MPVFFRAHERRVFRQRRALILRDPSHDPCLGLSRVCFGFSLTTASSSTITSPRRKVSEAQEGLTERIDWVIQESALEGMQPWASAVFAHNSYFSNIDLIMFLINRLNEGQQEEEEGTEEGKLAEDAQAAV